MNLSAYHRIVVKVGSALLVDQEEGRIKASWMQTLCADIADLKARGCDVVVVSSGAIALGRRLLKMEAGKLSLAESQAAAMAGQPSLIGAWMECMKRHNIVGGQGLLTRENVEDTASARNARTALQTLIRLGGVPVVNENDAIATAEITYGDNDRLSAYVARLAEADLLILLSDIDGLYTANPALDKNAAHVPYVGEITPEIEAMAGEAVSEISRGGMKTKIMAARVAMESGCSMIIASGHVRHPVRAIRQGQPCTVFRAPKPVRPS